MATIAMTSTDEDAAAQAERLLPALRDAAAAITADLALTSR